MKLKGIRQRQNTGGSGVIFGQTTHPGGVFRIKPGQNRIGLSVRIKVVENFNRFGRFLAYDHFTGKFGRGFVNQLRGQFRREQGDRRIAPCGRKRQDLVQGFA